MAWVISFKTKYPYDLELAHYSFGSVMYTEKTSKSFEN